MVATKSIGESLAAFQGELRAKGESLSAKVRREYADRWISADTRAALAIRTDLVLALHEFLAGRGLLNIDRVSLSPVTDPLAHDVESVPIIPYKSVPYRTTHSMIYSKMLACMNPGIPGIFVDSPNIRLELPSDGVQRGKYLVDFSQMDIELRRESLISTESYFKDGEGTARILRRERDRILDFLEDAIVFSVRHLIERRSAELAALGVRLEVPAKPFPRFDHDEAVAAHGEKDLEAKLGKVAGTQFFWILGLLRENYDLVYPFLDDTGKPRSRADIRSAEVYNYDLCASSLFLDGSRGTAYEVLSGGLREWIFSIVVERLLVNGILSERPRFDARGELENVAALEGYAPFLTAARMSDAEGRPLFPETAGGGLGIERVLFALLKGPHISRIEEVTLFGKNPDSEALYLF